MKTFFVLSLLTAQLAYQAVAQSTAGPQVKTANGMVEGVTEASGIRAFKGVPFAQPPVGDLRWKEPQPVKNWQGVRKADHFGPRAMQRAIFGDMGFRSDGMSEDCLYLNVWTPAKSSNEKLPVLVYFYGGGFVAGDGSEARYDGESMAKKGIVALTVNYRLGVFGFMAHPELTKESPHHASSNYGYLDQTAALRWVQQNIAAFGGDPKKVTIAGESAGSVSVSAQMVSPLSKNLIAGAIGESGSLLGTLPPSTLSAAEEMGVKFATGAGANSLAELRAMSAEKLLEATAKPGVPWFTSAIDGYFFPKAPADLYAAGEQAHVPLLVGWNSEEMNYRALLGQEKPTVDNYVNAVKKLYKEQADEVLKVYPASTDEQVVQAATDLASDRFIGYSTWRWSDIQAKTGGGKAVYRYMYARPRPAMTAAMGDAAPGLAGGVVKGGDAAAMKMPPARGAVHSAEIEYAMGNLASNKVYAWTPDDYKVSEVMQNYFANFIKTGNPNGPGLPKWGSVTGDKNVPVMHIDVNTQGEIEKNRARYVLLDQLSTKQ
ncbi:MULTISPECIES: carboxylesterase family protein [unclassified Spirosoma]|uniref:carboxylesterase/lipase family protein n=1 Tax=unclassified Spirosoma TaxID=2621999 RepID=UPI000969DE55|nr:MULTISPECIES: carboxylesterase family protein [unclassified Spirosoma]MBN8825353.1 carboxylesterase family protein [Spirosoma sp.]OJW77477.1 MAG: carboxylesterase [Spirosoma sp. 48-14]